MISASAPASSANLGAGYDVLAVAWELRCTVSVTPADRWEITSTAAPVDAAASDLVRAAAGEGTHPWKVHIESEIPVGRGLGSSAALIVAVTAAVGRAAGDPPDDDELFRRACAVEGHPDNVAAAVFGGLVATAGGRVRRLQMSSRLTPLLGIPATTLATTDARRALPERIDHAAAVRSVARAVFLVDGLRTGDGTALSTALGDELHEAYRRPLAPITEDLKRAALGAGAVYAAWSGAGPSVVALAAEGAAEQVAEALEQVLAGAGQVLQPQVADLGWS